MRTGPDLKWYALYTNPRAEKKVEKELAAKGYATYLPVQKILKQWSDRKKWIEEPLFKSYLFIKADISTDYYKVLETPGIVKFVRLGNEISPVRDSQIEGIRLLLANFTDIELTASHIESGSKVEVIAGPLKGHSGIAIERKGAKYFSIEIEQLGTNLLVSIPAQYLKNL